MARRHSGADLRGSRSNAGALVPGSKNNGRLCFFYAPQARLDHYTSRQCVKARRTLAIRASGSRAP